MKKFPALEKSLIIPEPFILTRMVNFFFDNPGQSQVSVPVLMTLRKEKLEAIRSELLNRREALAADLRQATADFINDDAAFADSVDQASFEVDKTLALQMKNRERDVLWSIDEALRRLDAGSFGDCERCGEEISEARMKANPATTLCIDCKAELESEQGRFPGRA